MVFPNEIKTVLHILQEAGFDAYAVGGCVRDSLLHRTPHDWDVTTSAHPADTERIFRAKNYPVRTGNGLKHGTVTVMLPTAQEECEITTFRTEGSYTDHRRPDTVEFVTDIQADLARRDFTINAMASKPGIRAEETVFVDPYGGMRDLADGVIRCVGEPSRRFQEDALRILRGIRFAARYGFHVEDRTAEAMLRERELLWEIAPERIGEELRGILAGDACGAQIVRFAPIFLQLLDGFELGCAEWFSDVPDALVRMALLLRNTPDGAIRKILLRYGFGHTVAERIARIVHEKDAPVQAHPDLCRLADRFGEDTERYFLFRRLLSTEPEQMTACGQRCLSLFQPGVCYNTATLAVRGNDLSENGVRVGVEIGRCLAWLTGEVIQGRLPNEREVLLAAVRQEWRMDNSEG